MYRTVLRYIETGLTDFRAPVWKQLRCNYIDERATNTSTATRFGICYETRERSFSLSRRLLWRMPSSGMLRRVALVRTDVSEEHRTSIISERVFLRSVRRLLVTSNLFLHKFLSPWWWRALRSSKTSVLTRATRHNIPEDGILEVLLLPKFPILSRYQEYYRGWEV
jgi:hypothetical protein